MAWLLYILQCADGSFYVGIAQDVAERVKRHNSGDGAEHTRAHRPVVLVHTESYATYIEARRREIQVKKWGRRKKGELIRGVKESLTSVRDKITS
ncbi:GIY-YIG nuclease family protein [Candidatus Uhrbacteria bacterium]|nr:GIY-YIG nuclease family protein [Candidatus Uhrbacteria bacterium]